MMGEQSTHALLLDQAVYQELTRRAAGHAQDHESNHWAEYFLLLDACQQIVASAPKSIEACEQLDIEAKLSEDLGRLANLIGQVLPGGMIEFSSYLPGVTQRHRPGNREL